MIEKIVRKTIEEHDLLEKGDHVILGLSGGPDSVCLFFVLLGLKAEFGLDIRAVHVNHMLRPGDAERDQEYVEAICDEAGVACSVSVCDCARIAKERGVTNEEAGRDLRYEAFYRAAKELIDEGIPASKIKIAVAQNKNDQAETLLMRIIRGTGITGLSGIDYKRPGDYGADVIRPLLDAGRNDIEDYCKGKNIVPRIDHTNEQPLYTRNKVRLELIPFLAEGFNENIIEALNRLSRSAKEDNEYLRKQAKTAYRSLIAASNEDGSRENTGESVVLSREGLMKAEPAIRRRVILMAFREIGLVQDITAAHLELADNIIFSGSASAEAHFPGGYVMSVSYKTAVARRSRDEKAVGPAERRISDPSVMPIGAYMARAASKTAGIAAFDYGRLAEITDDVLGGLEARGRRPGDYFTPKGMKSGRKKVQDYFVDRKIPKEDRDGYRLVALGEEVICIAGRRPALRFEINEKYKVTDDTKEVLLLDIGSLL